MARVILVEGLSGTGKSTAWRNVPSTESMVITPNGKGMPFPGAKAKYTRFDPSTGLGNVIITKQLNDLAGWFTNINAGAPHIKYILVDDFTHFFTARITSKEFIAQNSGNAAFAKWNQFGADVVAAIFSSTADLREDLTLVINHHTSLNEAGKYVFKTSGKLLDNVVDPVSYFTYVFHTAVLEVENKREYMFITNADGIHEAKTPMGCFSELYVPNDIFECIKVIEKYEKGE